MLTFSAGFVKSSQKDIWNFNSFYPSTQVGWDNKLGFANQILPVQVKRSVEICILQSVRTYFWETWHALQQTRGEQGQDMKVWPTTMHCCRVCQSNISRCRVLRSEKKSVSSSFWVKIHILENRARPGNGCLANYYELQRGGLEMSPASHRIVASHLIFVKLKNVTHNIVRNVFSFKL